MHCLLAAVPLLLALQEPSKAKRIEGGTAHRFQGVSFDLPPGWKFRSSSEGTALVPDDANQGGVLEEAYFLLSDPAQKSIDGEGFAQALEEAVGKLQPGATRQGTPKGQTYGDLEGRFFRYRAETDDGRAVDVRVHAFMGSTCACALLAFGFKEVVAKRNADLKAILGSMTRAQDGAEAPPDAVKRIPGGKACRFRGIAFDIPKSWAMKSSAEGAALVPEGANRGGVLEEAYVLVHDASVKSLDAPEFGRIVEALVEKLQPGAAKQGGTKKRKFGALDGRALVYRGATEQGKDVEIRVYGFMSGAGACALVAFGYAELVTRREEEIAAILASMWKPKSNVREELVGEWGYMKNVHNDQGGVQTNTFLTLRADGTYLLKGESSIWSKGGGDSSSTTHETGTWSCTESTLTLTPEGGEARTYALEKRNHPKNKNDPMIVLDGKAWVTTTRRAPWPD